MAILLQSSPAQGVFVDSLDITLTCDTPSAVIQYTLNGDSPLCPAATIYTGTPIHITAPTSDVEITFKAVAYTDTEISNRIEDLYLIVCGAADSDNDGILNADESPNTDTDLDGTPDYLDLDSDNDGLPDSLEGTEDYDNDGIPNFIDPDQVEDFIYEFNNFPPTGPLTEYALYTFDLTIKNGSATMSMLDVSEYLVYPEEYNEDKVVSAGDVLTFTFMPSACRPDDSVEIIFTFTEIPSGTVYTEASTFDFVSADQGIQITWAKNSKAASYRIYKENITMSSMSLLVEVPHDPSTFSPYQWYVDTTGTTSDRYSVSPVDENGLEGIMTLPRQAPDISTSMCLVQGNIADLGMSPLEDVCIACRISKTPTNIQSTFIQKGSMLLYTDARGYFEMEVPQGAIILLAIDSVGFKKELIIPSVYSINIVELLNHPANLL